MASILGGLGDQVQGSECGEGEGAGSWQRPTALGQGTIDLPTLHYQGGQSGLGGQARGDPGAKSGVRRSQVNV